MKRGRGQKYFLTITDDIIQSFCLIYSWFTNINNAPCRISGIFENPGQPEIKYSKINPEMGRKRGERYIMKKLLAALLVIAFSCAVIALNYSSASAAPSCTGWMKQNDGSYWRTCVDDKGRQYCQSSKNGHITKVVCR